MNHYIKLIFLSIIGFLCTFSSSFSQSQRIIDLADKGDPDAQFQLALLYY